MSAHKLSTLVAFGDVKPDRSTTALTPLDKALKLVPLDAPVATGEADGFEPVAGGPTTDCALVDIVTFRDLVEFKHCSIMRPTHADKRGG